jgi:hypothetical protein
MDQPTTVNTIQNSISKKGMVFIFISKVMFMEAHGKTTNLTVSESIILPMATLTKVKLSMVKRKVLVYTIMQMEMFILGRGKMIKKKDKATWFIRMETHMKEILLMEGNKETGFTHGPMATFTKGLF